MDSDADRLLVKTRRHQRGKVGVVGLPNIHRQGLEAGTPTVSGVARKWCKGLLVKPVDDVLEMVGVGARAPEL